MSLFVFYGLFVVGFYDGYCDYVLMVIVRCCCLYVSCAFTCFCMFLGGGVGLIV